MSCFIFCRNSVPFSFQKNPPVNPTLEPTVVGLDDLGGTRLNQKKNKKNKGFLPTRKTYGWITPQQKNAEKFLREGHLFQGSKGPGLEQLCDRLASGRCAGASIPKAARRPLFPSPEMRCETSGTFNCHFSRRLLGKLSDTVDD